MRDETSPDAQVGQLFRRLSTMRVELGEPAFERTIRDLLKTLGSAALREAEARAQVLRDRGVRRPGDIAVRPFAARSSPMDPWPGDFEGDQP
ncbi:hypothetical protein [Methylobacterium aquaticum]|uniref:Uncharacterized protein n=1 Tax=Methylobacterium aquaticum TaxID=270351 RepID=A0A1Y0ZBT3_9HYPH|nr:hypothetical protein [Methylobacterium aquaticum]BAR47150.1 hypothetical protein Maq22A_c28220 [Methylobacterium aquaticum]